MMIPVAIIACLLLVEVNCGHSIEPRITNGEDSIRFQFEFMASIQLMQPHTFIYVHICGGTVIGEFWILSTAVCVQKTDRLDTARVKVYMYYTEGDDNISVQIIPIANRIIHEYFDGSSDSRPNNIALIKLETGIVNCVAAKLPDLRYPTPDTVLMLGWGRTSHDSSAQKSRVLQYAAVSVISNHECWGLLEQSREILDSHICTYIPGRAATAAMGDNGGPLISYIDGQPIIEGIISWNFVDNDQVESPTISTRVSHYIGWVIEKAGVKPNKMSDSDDLLTPLLVSS